MKTLQQFINDILGKPLAVLPASKPVKDGGNGPQCFDVPTSWCDSLGIPDYPGNPSPFPVDYASQIYTAFGDWQAKYFDRIANVLNDESNVPLSGDIIVFQGIPGHVALVEKADSNTVTVIEQNWNNVQVVTRRVIKDWKSILGWLHPKASPVTTNPTPPQSSTSTSPLEAKASTYTNKLNQYKDKLDYTYYMDDWGRIVVDFLTYKNSLEVSQANYTKLQEKMKKEVEEKQARINELSKQLQNLPKPQADQTEEIKTLKLQLKDAQEKLLYYHTPVFDFVDTLLKVFKKT